MKLNLNLWAVLLAAGVTAHADALNRQQVTPDAKWLIHVDCDNLRQTKVGGFLLTNFVSPKAEELGGQLKINVSNILSRISSLTAYGADFSTGPDTSAVLLINSDTDTHKALEGLLVAQILANTNGPIKKLEHDTLNLYSFGDQVFIAPQKDGPIIISKSQERIEALQQVLTGKSPGLDAKHSLSQFPVLSNNFFFLAIADAADLPNALPAKAKVIQMAEAGRVALGENQEQVVLDLALRGKTAEVTHQIQQVIEGMVALVSLGQPENVELADLAKSIKVSSVDQLIDVKLEYPATKAIARFNDQMAPKPEKEKAHKVRKAKQKPEKKPKVKAVEPSDDGDSKAEPAKPDTGKPGEDKKPNSGTKPDTAKPEAEGDAK